MESACRSPTRLTDASAKSRAVFSISDRRVVDCSGSKEGPLRGSVGKSYIGTVRHLAPLKKRTTEVFLPSNWPAIYSCYGDLEFGREYPLSSNSCRKDRTTDKSEVDGFCVARGWINFEWPTVRGQGTCEAWKRKFALFLRKFVFYFSYYNSGRLLGRLYGHYFRNKHISHRTRG